MEEVENALTQLVLLASRMYKYKGPGNVWNMEIEARIGLPDRPLDWKEMAKRLNMLKTCKRWSSTKNWRESTDYFFEDTRQAPMRTSVHYPNGEKLKIQHVHKIRIADR